MRKHWMYGAYGQMINRCMNPNNSSFGRYGALGVTVCDRWRFGEGDLLGFECFLADMGERPEGMTLDRIDPTKGYSPDNCRWATISEQRRNLSAQGDARMRSAMSKGVKERWAKWREANSVRAELATSAQAHLHGLLERPASIPTDGRVLRAYRHLTELGLASWGADSFEITDLGRAWIAGGRPAKRAVQVQ